ncbi:MAG TPA: MopE-related protein, partial [Polyangiaceae bacterium]
AIDWLADSHTTPNKFSPLCGFTATYVLNQAGSHYGLAWYNDTGTPPTAAQLHQLVAPNSAVGTTFTGTVIKSDPAYTGGVVGFALVGGETHYTNDAYDTTCTSCSPPGPWITALMYASTKTPNAYYICFEDGPTSATSWSNDGDFNDDVYFVTGISCEGGGVPCNTGKLGSCAAGLTQCTATGTTCQEIAPPVAETCNGVDDNCDGQVDEGNPCPEEYVCDKGTCVKSCSGGEFPCQQPLVCAPNGYCVDPACENVTCPTGQVCKSGTCKAPCDGITCPYPQQCRAGACVDPCAGVSCQTGQVCVEGVCLTSCTCAPCGQGEACNATSGMCGDTKCSTMTCTAGTHCQAGSCVDDCAGASCPGGATCTAGKCGAPADAGTDVDSGSGISGPGSEGGLAGADASVAGEGGSAKNGSSPFEGGAGGKGCACGTMGTGGGGDALLATVVAGLAVAGMRRRKRK